MSALLGCLLAVGAADVLIVSDDEELRAALRRARPGMTIRLEPGIYSGGLWLDASGTENEPIVIEASNAAQPPLIREGSEGIHLSGCSFVTLRNLRFTGQQANGVNADDAGRMDGSARGVVLEGLHVSDVNPDGNHDGIKLSGLTQFQVEGCIIEGWGGSAIDLVGCHEGTIERTRLRGDSQVGTGIQLKGGTSKVAIRACEFIHAGQRALNLGGSTGLPYFRPANATAEARDLLVEDCRFFGSLAPVAFVGSENVTVQRNVFILPQRWIIRILQETQDARFVPCRRGRFEDNTIIFRQSDLENHHVNVGPGTEPQSFVFAENKWYCLDAPERSRPDLPVDETGGTYGVRPNLEWDEARMQPYRSPQGGKAVEDNLPGRGS